MKFCFAVQHTAPVILSPEQDFNEGKSPSDDRDFCPLVSWSCLLQLMGTTTNKAPGLSSRVPWVVAPSHPEHAWFSFQPCQTHGASQAPASAGWARPDSLLHVPSTACARGAVPRPVCTWGRAGGFEERNGFELVQPKGGE